MKVETPRTLRGSFVVATIALIGLGLAATALWFRRAQTQPIIAHWGSDTIEAIRLARHARLVALEPLEQPPSHTAEPPAGCRRIGGRLYRLAAEVNLERQGGFDFFRQTLLERPTYRFDRRVPSPATITWRFLVRFRAPGGASAEILFARDVPIIAGEDGQRAVAISDVHARLVAYLETVLRRAAARPAD